MTHINFTKWQRTKHVIHKHLTATGTPWEEGYTLSLLRGSNTLAFAVGSFSATAQQIAPLNRDTHRVLRLVSPENSADESSVRSLCDRCLVVWSQF